MTSDLGRHLHMTLKHGPHFGIAALVRADHFLMEHGDSRSNIWPWHHSHVIEPGRSQKLEHVFYTAIPWKQYIFFWNTRDIAHQAVTTYGVFPYIS